MAASGGSMMPVTTKPVASPVASQSFPPAPSGMNISMPAHEIADTEAPYMQDILLDQPGIARRRGPVQSVAGQAALSHPAVGLAITADPNGVLRYAALVSQGTSLGGQFAYYPSASFTPAVLDTNQPNLPWPTSPYPLVHVSPALTKGVFIGTSSGYGANPSSQMLLWWAGSTVAANPGETITTTRGSTAVTGTGTTWTTTVSPGMWLARISGGNTSIIGMVKTINSDTSLTLDGPALYTFTSDANGFFFANRGIQPKVGKGTITVASGSTSVAGGNTKFQKQGVGTGSQPWDIYRLSDMTWVGTVSSVQSDIGLTLSAGAAVAMADDAYVAFPQSIQTGKIQGVSSSTSPGFITSVYANRQWYANNGTDFVSTYRLWFSDPADPEILDLTQDGDWLPINSTGEVQEPITGLASAYNALIVTKESETFGVFGSDPTSFQVTKLADDGAINGMSMQQYRGGVIWAGRGGIHFFDGTQVADMTAPKFGPHWREIMQTFDATQYRMWSMMERDHYILHIEHLTPTISVTKGSTTTTPNHWVVVLNMVTGAITLWQNVKFRGAQSIPASEQEESYFVYNDGTKGVIAKASTFFDNTGNDPLIEGVSGAGPDFYLESKKMDGGSPTRLKRFTYWILNYLIVGDAINIDTVLGMNSAGTNAASGATGFPASSTWTVDRLRFLKKDRLLAFRLYQNSSSVTDFRIGNWEIGFKPMRPGRI